MPGRIELPALKRLLADAAQLVDVLPAAEYAEVHLPRAINIPLKQLDRDRSAALDRRRPAHNLPVERRDALVTAGQLARADVVTRSLSDAIGEIGPRIAASPYGFALVVSSTGVLLGRLRSTGLGVAPETRVEEAPSTLRPDLPANEVAKQLRESNLQTAILATPEGNLIGVARRADLEQRISTASPADSHS
jgi:hypothetical protein